MPHKTCGTHDNGSSSPLSLTPRSQNYFRVFSYTMARWWCRRRKRLESTPMVQISFQFIIVEYDRCVLGACFLLYTSKRKHPGSTHNRLLIPGNLHQVGNFSRKNPWVPAGCRYKYFKTQGCWKFWKSGGWASSDLVTPPSDSSIPGTHQLLRKYLHCFWL